MSRRGGAGVLLVLWVIALTAALVGVFEGWARVDYVEQRVRGDDA